MYTSKNPSTIKIFLMSDKTIWFNLPWRNIYLRILMIKKRIYLSSKKNDLQSVHKLQNYLINCNEAKIILVNKAINKLYLYYSNYQQISLHINQLDKFKLLKSIFIKTSYKNKTLNTLTKEIKQSLIRYSVKPAFEARLSKQFYQLQNINELQRYYFDFKSLQKHNILVKNIARKLTSYNYINDFISKWLHETNCFSLLNKYNLNYKTYFVKKNSYRSTNNLLVSTSLFDLICEIIQYDIYWYHFICYRTNSLLPVRKINSIFYDRINYFYNKGLKKLDVYSSLLINDVQFILLCINNSTQSKHIVFHRIFNMIESIVSKKYKRNMISKIQYDNSIYNLSTCYNLRKRVSTKLFYINKKELLEKTNRINNQQNYIYYLSQYYLK